MNLQSRVLLLYLCIAVLVLVLIGGVLPASLQEQNLNTISGDTINQLRHIDFAISNFIGEVRYDVLALSLDEDVRTPDNAGFTNFLNASEDTFRYSYSEKEQDIIDTFWYYQTTHPYVSSVYMGRENGASVRSFPRARPTQYDPRDRPWYILAKEHPGQVMVTDPYQAVTTPDINIGIVKALLNQNGTVFGVVGADITLVNLTSYISRFDVGRNGEMVLVDQNGMILAARNSSRLFGNISDVLQDQTTAFLTTKEGVLILNGTYLMYYTSPELGWKIGVFVPFSSIEEKINESIARILLFVLLALILLSVITIIMLNQTIIRPLSSLTEVSRRIAETGDLDQKIETGGTGEIGTLARSFKTMVEKIHTDITERERAEEALRESDEFNRSLVENLPDIIAIYDNKGIVRFANQAGLNILGSPASKVIGEPILSFVADYQRSDVEQKMRARLSGVPVAPYEVDIRTGGGEIITAILQAVPIRYRKEPVVLVLMTDITARKQAEQRLLEAHRDLEKKVIERTRELSDANARLQELDRLKSMFIASMSHELRTPLNSIIGFTGIMAKGLAGEINAEQKKQLGMVQDSARHLLALINDVIDISKIEAGKIEAGVSTFNLADVIREVGNTLDQAAQDRGLILNVEIPGTIPVTSDERRIKQIIMNLMSNAIKFTDEGIVDLTVTQKGAVVEVCVRDTGIGISMEDLERLFRPFVRVHVPGRLTEGTGLGLYLSQKLARFLGGDIMAESELRKGSVFTFSFPVTYEKQEEL
jgi:methyl-accepting chemotaxis protein